MSAIYDPQRAAPMQNSFGQQKKQNPYQQQSSQPQQNQQQASPFSAPDMSVYSQQSPYNAYNVPRTPPKGARVNDLSGNVPSNQIGAQAYNQAAKQYGGDNRATSFTMPGSYNSQVYNPQTGVYGPQTDGQSWDGNMAYNSIDTRPGPFTATSTFAGGKPMDFQAGLNQRMAFAGNLSNRLNQYSGGQLSGPVTFDQGQLMQQANDQLANGTFVNPFMQQQAPQDPFTQAYNQMNPPVYDPAVQQQMNNSQQFFQGSQPWQNPLGNNAANIPTPSWGQREYNPSPNSPGQSSFEQFLSQRGLMNDYNAWDFGRQLPPPVAPTAPQGDPMSRSPATWTDADIAAVNQAGVDRFNSQKTPMYDSGVRYYRDPSTGKVLSDSFSGRGQDATANWDAGQKYRAEHPTPVPLGSQSPARPTSTPAPAATGAAQSIAPATHGDQYDPANAQPSLPPAPPAAPAAASPSYGEDPIAAKKKSARDKSQSDSDLQTMRDHWLSGATTGKSYREHVGGKKFVDHTPSQMADEYTGELWKRLHDGRLSQADYDKAVAAMDTDLGSSKGKQSQLAMIDGEINKWQRATYGTWQGNGPPASYAQHIRDLQALRQRAASGDPGALAWKPKAAAPAAHVTSGAGQSGGFKNKKYTQQAGNARVTN